MPVYILQSGLGEILGGDLGLAAPLYMRPNVWWANSTTGVDAASPAGSDRSHPVKTLTQALTNSANGDVIVLEDGFIQTFVSALTIAKTVTIVGGGSSAGIPTCQLLIDAAAAACLSIIAFSVELRNIRFPPSVQVNTSAAVGKIDILGGVAGVRLRNLYVESSGNDQLSGVRLGTAASTYTAPRIESSTFISTATSLSSRPTRGLEALGTIPNLELRDVVFSDGTVGYVNAAADLSAATITGMKGSGIALLLGADMLVPSAATGYVSVPVMTGGGRVSW